MEKIVAVSANLLSWFTGLDLSDQIGIIGIVVSVLTSVTSFVLGIISLMLSHRYKKQADSFSDTQFMPEFFPVSANEAASFVNKHDIPDVFSYGYGYGYSLGEYCAMKAPIYQLEIDSVFIEKQRIDVGDGVQRKKIDIYPTQPVFRIKISIPEKVRFSKERYNGTVFLTYQSMYGITYQKKITFVFQGNSNDSAIDPRDIKQFCAGRR